VGHRWVVLIPQRGEIEVGQRPQSGEVERALDPVELGLGDVELSHEQVEHPVADVGDHLEPDSGSEPAPSQLTLECVQQVFDVIFFDGEVLVAAEAHHVSSRPPEPDFPSVHAVEPLPAQHVPPLLQLRRTYMMFEHDDGVVLIDQHSAHERVLYEQFMGMLERGEAPSQRLLFPLTLHLTPAESDAFEANRVMLATLGFEVEGFGGHTLVVHSVPLPHPRFDAERCLRETLATLAGDRDASVHARHERLAATVACKAAIKAGDELSTGEMRALFIALGNTKLPAHDVHGRSTIVQLSWSELERRFGRQ